MDEQLYLTIILLIIEVVAFAWLILDNMRSKKKQDQIIKLEKQILNLEESIMASETKILDEISNLVKMLKDIPSFGKSGIVRIALSNFTLIIKF